MAHYVSWVNGLQDLHRALLIESPVFHPAATIRASALESVGGWRDGDFPEDYDLWLRMVAGGWRLGAVPVPVVALRDRPERLTRTDPRYRRAAFRLLKMQHLAATRLASPKRVVVWGAGRAGRPWIRWLLKEQHTIPVVVDPFRETTRQGVPVRGPEELLESQCDLLIVAVGARGARATIRNWLRANLPGWEEGLDWIAVA